MERGLGFSGVEFQVLQDEELRMVVAMAACHVNAPGAI
jgi:hypothetical protein